ncbi:unnamed protein product [Paramecium sonneborni]|uniref:Uncharacterized protein n=1 Tax=Paramecium sonneborni TaxID=65129 RepID=A0A8S1PN47_9CILI|nr:unnamed protein product [Paramecium sonneborni]
MIRRVYLIQELEESLARDIEKYQNFLQEQQIIRENLVINELKKFDIKIFQELENRFKIGKNIMWVYKELQIFEQDIEGALKV